MTRWLYLSIALTIAILVGTVYVYQTYYDLLPEQVPTHFNLQNQPDGWTPRDQLLPMLMLLPATMVGFVVLTVALPWLSPRQFRIDSFRGTYGFIMALAVALMGMVQASFVWVAFRQTGNIGHLIFAGLFLFLMAIGSVLANVHQNFWIGVRTPWTLASTAVWQATHRLAAWLFVFGGLLGFIGVLADAPLVFGIVLLALIALGPVLFSLIHYKRLERLGRL